MYHQSVYTAPLLNSNPSSLLLILPLHLTPPVLIKTGTAPTNNT